MRMAYRTSAAILIRATLALYAGAPCHGEGLPLCADCDLLIGVGTTYRTYHSFGWTDGWVLPLTLELDDSRWELGAFRFATAQRAHDVNNPPASGDAANPYWGFTAMRRWQVLHRPWGRLYLGFGANYRTEIDYLEATRWNFAWLAAVRFPAGRSTALELGIRHWSNAWLKFPNRGQDLLTVSFVF